MNLPEEFATASEILDAILSALSQGRTVYVSNHMRHTKVTPKTLASWNKSGYALFKVSGNSLMMASGRKFVCIDGSKFTVQ